MHTFTQSPPIRDRHSRCRPHPAAPSSVKQNERDRACHQILTVSNRGQLFSFSYRREILLRLMDHTCPSFGSLIYNLRVIWAQRQGELINGKICIGSYLHDAYLRSIPGWEFQTPMGLYIAQMRINPFILTVKLSRSNAAISRFGRDMSRSRIVCLSL